MKYLFGDENHITIRFFLCDVKEMVYIRSCFKKNYI